jgi:putative SOS response-associated peptidase YedK
MCGRYTVRSSPRALRDHFGLAEEPTLFPPRYNVAPSQAVPVVRQGGDGRRQLSLLRWGLPLPWARGASDRAINGRAETAAEKAPFRHAIRKRRCLVAADGFYEWAPVGRRKQPYFFQLKGGGPFAIAGVWQSGEDGSACALLTCKANGLVRPVHGRMPVILAPADYGEWLDPELHDPDALEPLLQPYPAEGMEAYPVGPHVNDPRHDGPECVEPAESGEGT